MPTKLKAGFLGAIGVVALLILQSIEHWTVIDSVLKGLKNQGAAGVFISGILTSPLLPLVLALASIYLVYEGRKEKPKQAAPSLTPPSILQSQTANPHMEQRVDLGLGDLIKDLRSHASPTPPKGEPSPESNLVLIPGVKMGTLYLLNDSWSRTPLSGYQRPNPHKALWVEVKNRADDRIVGPADGVRAELRIGDDEYSPLFWIDSHYNLVKFEFGQSHYVVLAVDMSDGSRRSGDWRIPANRRDYDYPSGLNALDLDNAVKVTMKDARVLLNLLDVEGGRVLRSIQGIGTWRQEMPWFEFH
jgi:hypothetical protein